MICSLIQFKLFYVQWYIHIYIYQTDSCEIKISNFHLIKRPANTGYWYQKCGHRHSFTGCGDCISQFVERNTIRIHLLFTCILIYGERETFSDVYFNVNHASPKPCIRGIFQRRNNYTSKLESIIYTSWKLIKKKDRIWTRRESSLIGDMSEESIPFVKYLYSTVNLTIHNIHLPSDSSVFTINSDFLSATANTLT